VRIGVWLLGCGSKLPTFRSRRAAQSLNALVRSGTEGKDRLVENAVQLQRDDTRWKSAAMATEIGVATKVTWLPRLH
jgi:hypothetical protein